MVAKPGVAAAAVVMSAAVAIEHLAVAALVVAVATSVAVEVLEGAQDVLKEMPVPAVLCPQLLECLLQKYEAQSRFR